MGLVEAGFGLVVGVVEEQMMIAEEQEEGMAGTKPCPNSQISQFL